MKYISVLSLVSCYIFIQNCAHLTTTFSPNDLKSHVAFLASDKLEGRYPGTQGGRDAAAYIRDEFKNNNLTLLGDEGFQYFNVVTGVSLGEKNNFTFNGESLSVGSDFSPLSFSENTSLVGPLFVAGYGFSITNDTLNWNDYSNTDLKGKWVMIFRGAPDGDNPHGPYSEHSSLRTKVMTAKDNGAAGVLFISGIEFDTEDQLIDLAYEQNQIEIGIPVIHITRNIANKILAKRTISEIEKELLNKLNNFKPFFINTVISANTDIIYESVTTQNVIAALPGNDSELKNEFIVIGAHYDHLGYGGDNSGSRRPDNYEIHNGADDNASGVSAVIELSREFSEYRQNKRTLVFMAFGAEEMGLLGSKYFVKNPLIEKDKIQIMLNMDMVGRLDKTERIISIGGTHTAINLEEYVEEIIKEYSTLKYTFSPEGYGPSDHSSFYVNDTPVLFFFTGAHSDYHTPEDDIDKVNYKGMSQISELILNIASSLDDSEKLTFQEAGPKTEQKRQRFKVTLGIMPDYTYSETKGLRIDAVLHDKPAYVAGILDGDIIISMAGKPVGDIYEYMHRLGELSAGETAPVVVVRGENEIEFSVKF